MKSLKMNFKITLIVLCLLITCLSLLEGVNGKDHKNKGHDASKKDKHPETRVSTEDKLQPIRLSRKATQRQANDGTDVESGEFNFDFDKIPGGAGIKIIFDGLKNIFMAINRVLNFGFIWDGINGIISLFKIDTGAMFVINAVKKVGGFAGYMLTDVKEFIEAMTSGGAMIVGSALKLAQSGFRFITNRAPNALVNVMEVINAILGVNKQNLEDVLGPVYKVVSGAFNVLFTAVAKLAKNVGDGLMVLLEPILGAIRFVTAPIVDVLSAVLRTAGGIFDSSVFQAIAKGLNDVLQNVVGGVVGGVKGVTGGIFGTLTGAINGVGCIFKNVGDAVGSVLFGGSKEGNTTGYTNIGKTTIQDEEPIHITYANKDEDYIQHFIREGEKQADLIIFYKGGKENFIAFYNKITRAVFIVSGTKGHISIIDTENGAGLYFEQNSTTGYAIQPPGFLRADFIGPNAKNVSDALTTLSKAIDDLNIDMDSTVDLVTIDIVEALRSLTLKNTLSAILTGETLIVVSRLLGNLLYGLAKGLSPMIRPSLGVANALLPFLLNLPQNLVNGIISLIGSVVKRFLGIFVPEFVSQLAKMVVTAVLKGLTTPLLAPLLTPFGAISTAVNVALFAANSALDLLNIK